MPVPSSRGRALCWAGGMQGVAAPPASPGVGWEAVLDPGLHPKACGHGAEGGDYFPLCSALLRPYPGFKAGVCQGRWEHSWKGKVPLPSKAL